MTSVWAAGHGIQSRRSKAEAIAIFLNSTYGLIIRVGYGQSTDLGRSTIQVRAIDNHPIPDFGADTDESRQARSIAAQHFNRLRTLPLKRISLSVLDPNREEIDRVATLMLGIPWNDEFKSLLAYWRRLMCLQPVVHANNQETLRILNAAGIQP